MRRSPSLVVREAYLVVSRRIYEFVDLLMY